MISGGIIIQARMGSTRLAGKVMIPICGIPVIEHMVRRLASVPVDRGIVVATTINPADDVLADFCCRSGIGCYRGDEENVLGRCLEAAECFGFDAVIRLGGDSPLCDPAVVTKVHRCFLEQWARGRKLDYASNTLDRRFPVGLDVEVFHRDTLKRIAGIVSELGKEEQRLNQANVVPYMHAHPEMFAMLPVGGGPDYSELRWTLDTPADLDLITRIYEALFPVKPIFGMADVLDLLDRNPQWSTINAGVIPVSGYWTDSERRKFEKRYGRSGPDDGKGQ